MFEKLKAIIMAGGKGTRLSSLTNDLIPKPLVNVANKPIIAYQLDWLLSEGIKEVTIIIGHLKEKIVEYIESSEYKTLLEINYIKEDIPLGTAGALYYLKEEKKDDFLIIFGDTIFDIDLKRMYRYHQKKQSLITLFVHPNSHPFDSDVLFLNSDDRIIKFDSKNNVRDYYYPNSINAGFYILKKEVITQFDTLEKRDLDKDIIKQYIENKQNVFGYKSTEYIKDVGTVARISQVEKDLKEGIVHSRNLSHPQKCIFLDRDGTINVYKGFINSHRDIELLANVGKAIKLINESGYLAIVISNQPVIARGEATFDEVEEMHYKIADLLAKDEAYLDDIAYCPHHPDSGFVGERPELKIKCRCRKPNTLLIEQMIEKYNIDVRDSWMIGDSVIDIETGKNAKLKTAFVKTGKEYGETGVSDDYLNDVDVVASDLYEAVLKIIR